MKTYIAILFALLATSSYAQITLERELVDSNLFFSLVQVDSGEYYYITQYATTDTGKKAPDIRLYDLDFNLVKTIDVPVQAYMYATVGDVVTYISRRLFDLDDSIEYLFARSPSGATAQTRSKVVVFKESGTVVFSCDTCALGYSQEHFNDFERGIYNTPRGVKMLVRYYYNIGNPFQLGNRVYSLPGKLPTSSVAAEDIAYIQSALDIEAVPNPASDHVRVTYNLPAGTTSGFITIRDTKGAELQRHRINNFDQHISLDTRTLSPGSYYCCLLSEDGRTTVRKMMVVR